MAVGGEVAAGTGAGAGAGLVMLLTLFTDAIDELRLTLVCDLVVGSLLFVT